MGPSLTVAQLNNKILQGNRSEARCQEGSVPTIPGSRDGKEHSLLECWGSVQCGFYQTLGFGLTPKILQVEVVVVVAVKKQ